MKKKSKKRQGITNLQNKFRGLESKLRSHSSYVKKGEQNPVGTFRRGLRNLLLDARARLSSDDFSTFLKWIYTQKRTRLPELDRYPLDYDELSGLNTGAPEVSLERELIGIVTRLKFEAQQINKFLLASREVERLFLSRKIEESILSLATIQETFGVSLWSIELRIALEQFAGGLERQKRYTAEVRSNCPRGLINFITYYISVRNEERSTYSKFCEDISFRINNSEQTEPYIKTYLDYRLSGKWPTAKSGLAQILRAVQTHPLIDLYETFVAVVQEIIRREDFELPRQILLTHLSGLVNIDDYRLGKINNLLAGEVKKSPYPIRSSLISEELLKGNVKKSLIAAKRIFRDPEEIDAWQYIYAGVAYSHSATTKAQTVHSAYAIPKLIGNILRRDEEGANSYSILEKFLNNFRGFSTSASLLDFLPILRRPYPDDSWRPWLIGLNSPVYGVEDIPPSCPAQFHSFEKAGKITHTTWAALFKGLIESPEVSIIAKNIFNAAGLIINRNFDQVITTLKENPDTVVPKLYRSFRCAMLLHAYFSLDYKKHAIELIADEGSRSEVDRKFLPVLPTLEHYVWNDYKSVNTPLASTISLHLLWSIDQKDSTASYLRYATGKVIKSSGQSLPSEMFESQKNYPKHQLVYFLREVCVPRILDGTRVFNSSRDVINERQNICTTLRAIDPSNADTYQDEIMLISNQLAMDDGQWIVDRTRIHVDIDALSRWAKKEFSDDFSRYRDLLSVEVGNQLSFDDVLREISQPNSSWNSNLPPETEADALLFSILNRFGDEFLTNPTFGLDFYLSKRIRHQSFIGFIRGPLEFKNLITTRVTGSGQYHRNSYWIDMFTQLSLQDRNKLDEAFVKFATKIDDILISAKDNKFHLLSQDHPSGLLYLNFTPQLRAIARAILVREKNLSDFIETLVHLIWSAFEPSLANVRDYVSDQLKNKLTSTFDELRANCRRIAENDSHFLDLDYAIGETSSEIQRKLDEVSSWFNHVDIEAQRRRFSLEQIVNISLDYVLRCQRSFEPEVSLNIIEQCEMPSSNLVFVHDVLFIALDNVRLHSGLKKPKISISVKPDFENSILILEILSESKSQLRHKHEGNLSEIRQMILGGNVERRTRLEGRSGILKIAAVVQQTKQGKIDFGFNEDNYFRLAVTYSLISLEPDGA